MAAVMKLELPAHLNLETSIKWEFLSTDQLEERIEKMNNESFQAIKQPYSKAWRYINTTGMRLKTFIDCYFVEFCDNVRLGNEKEYRYKKIHEMLIEKLDAELVRQRNINLQQTRKVVKLSSLIVPATLKKHYCNDNNTRKD